MFAIKGSSTNLLSIVISVIYNVVCAYLFLWSEDLEVTKLITVRENFNTGLQWSGFNVLSTLILQIYIFFMLTIWKGEIMMKVIFSGDNNRCWSRSDYLSCWILVYYVLSAYIWSTLLNCRLVHRELLGLDCDYFCGGIVNVMVTNINNVDIYVYISIGSYLVRWCKSRQLSNQLPYNW